MGNHEDQGSSDMGISMPSVSRRTFLAGTAGVAAVAALAACGSDKKAAPTTAATTAAGVTTTSAAPEVTTTSAAAAAKKTITFGSNQSDAKPKNAVQAMMDAYKAKSGNDVKINTVDHNTYQEQITSYLGGTPDDVYSWFAAFRMQSLVNQNLGGDISDVWGGLKNQTDGVKAASTAADGKQYFVPLYYYPWAVFFRKSLFAEKGYTAPKTLAEFKALGDKMKADGLTPIAFGNDGKWPAMGTFDYLNLRTNGFKFHTELMAGKQAWDSAEVKAVFTTWAELLPYHQAGASARKWEDAAASLVKKESGMYTMGMFVSSQFKNEDLGDLDFFPFPEINPAHGQDSLEAPIDGYMMAPSPKDAEGAKSLLAFLASGDAANAYLKIDPGNLACATDADTSGYNDLQKKGLELCKGAKNVTQFLDRDTLPAFAGPAGEAFDAFLQKPGDIDTILKNLAAKAKEIFA